MLSLGAAATAITAAGAIGVPMVAAADLTFRVAKKVLKKGKSKRESTRSRSRPRYEERIERIYYD